MPLGSLARNQAVAMFPPGPPLDVQGVGTSRGGPKEGGPQALTQGRIRSSHKRPVCHAHPLSPRWAGTPQTC